MDFIRAGDNHPVGENKAIFRFLNRQANFLEHGGFQGIDMDKRAFNTCLAKSNLFEPEWH